MDYIIRKENNGYTVRANTAQHTYPEVWAYSTLGEALEGLRGLFNPPVMVPEGTVVIG